MNPASSYKTSYQDFKEKLTKELEDVFDLEPLSQAFTLPCGHSLNESTIAKISKICFICKTPFATPYKNLTIRNIAEIVKTMPVKDHSEEAELLFEKAKALCKTGKIEQAITLLSEVLDSCPNYQEVIGYNACLLDMLPETSRISQTKEKLIGILHSQISDEYSHKDQEEINLLKQAIGHLQNSIQQKATNRLKELSKIFEYGDYIFLDKPKRLDCLNQLIAC